MVISSVLVLLKSDIDDNTMHIMQHNCKMQCKTKALNNSFLLKAFTAYPIASQQKSKNVQIPVASSKTWGTKFMQKPLICFSSVSSFTGKAGDLSSHSQCTVQEFYHQRKASLTSLIASFPALDSPLRSGYFLLASSGRISDGLSMLHASSLLALLVVMSCGW